MLLQGNSSKTFMSSVQNMLWEPFGWTIFWKHGVWSEWNFWKIMFWKPYIEWTKDKQMTLYVFNRRDIGKEKMVCKNWGMYIKSLGNYEKFMVVYHKWSTKQGIAPVDKVYMVFKFGVCCKPNAPKSLLRYTGIEEFSNFVCVFCRCFLV